MYVSCSLLCCRKAEYPTVAEALAKVRLLGFGAIDLDAFETWQHVRPSELAAGGEAAVAELAGTLAATGLKVGSFNCGMSVPVTAEGDEAFGQYRREFLALLDLARRVGCGNLTVQPGGPQEGRDGEEVMQLVAGRLAELCGAAGREGVSVGIEAHHGSLLEAPEAALRMVSELCPAAGLTYDPSHFAMQEIALPETAALLDRAVHVHVRNAGPGRMQETMAAGTVDFHWLIGALRARGYDGPVAIEYFSGFDADFASTRALRDRLRELGVEG